VSKEIEMPQEKPVIEVDLGRINGTVTLATVPEVHAFILRHRDGYRWLNDEGAANVGGLYSTVQNKLAEIEQSANGLTSDDLSHVESVKSRMIQVFNHWRLPILGSSTSNFIEQLRTSEPQTAAAALASWLDQTSVSMHHFPHLKGAVLMAAFDGHITPETPSAVTESLRSLAMSFERSWTAPRFDRTGDIAR
jgi:hypothetical protein